MLVTGWPYVIVFSGHRVNPRPHKRTAEVHTAIPP
jgi:hypothetical protein